MNEKIKSSVMQRASSDQILKMAHAQAMKTMFEDGIEKVLQGITTLQEVLRVTSE